MAARITNQATLNYTSGTETLSTASNTASVTLQGPLNVTKYSLENNYQLGEDITYNIFVENTSAAPLNNITITDNLGTYPFTTSRNNTPLTYTGPAKAFIDNVYYGAVTGNVAENGESVSFTILALPAGSTLLLQYEAVVNEYAGASIENDFIINTASVTAAGISTPVTASNRLPVASYAAVVIEKQMSPDPVVDGSTLTYTFNITNYGTIDATNVVLHDTFNPAPVITSVSVDGRTDVDYSYASGVFVYPAVGSTNNYTIPAATFITDPETGVVTTVPGRSTIIIQGTI